MKAKINPATITLTIGDQEFILTLDQAEKLLAELKLSVEQIKPKVKIDEEKLKKIFREYPDDWRKDMNPPPVIKPWYDPHHIPSIPKPIEIWCQVNTAASAVQ